MPINLTQEDKALKKACTDFEALFLQEVFKAMGRTVPREPSLGRDIAEGFLYESVAQESANRGETGLAHYLYLSLRKK
jgi:flagellar protein FlgJ